MFKNIFIHEIQNIIYSLRFQISFIIIVFIFLVGGITFAVQYKENTKNYDELVLLNENELTERSGNISGLTTRFQNFIFPPRNSSIITDGKEAYLPNSINYNGYFVRGFSLNYNNNNPLLLQAESLSWSFLISMFLSFLALLFSFDAISGDKENRTLSLVFSNAVPRRIFYIAKLTSIVSVLLVMEIVAVLVNILSIIVIGNFTLDMLFFQEVLYFLIVSAILLTLFTSFGLLASSITHQSNISLLVSICFWIIVAIVVPNTASFWAAKLYPIPTMEELYSKIRAEHKDLNDNAPDGSWSSRGNDPFYERHELRANLQTNLMESEKRIRHEYYNQMFKQLENTRKLTLISPISQFDYINEGLIGGGYTRFRYNWDNLNVFQEMFLQWFKDKDAQDEKSPHWYNPYETYSTSILPVPIEEVPRYKEKPLPFNIRIENIAIYLIVMILTTSFIFLMGFWRFTRYDVR